jgi:hypothetical protein
MHAGTPRATQPSKVVGQPLVWPTDGSSSRKDYDTERAVEEETSDDESFTTCDEQSDNDETIDGRLETMNNKRTKGAVSRLDDKHPLRTKLANYVPVENDLLGWLWFFTKFGLVGLIALAIFLTYLNRANDHAESDLYSFLREEALASQAVSMKA